MRGADVDTGEKDGRCQAEDLSGADCVVHWMRDCASRVNDFDTG